MNAVIILCTAPNNASVQTRLTLWSNRQQSGSLFGVFLRCSASF